MSNTAAELFFRIIREKQLHDLKRQFPVIHLRQTFQRNVQFREGRRDIETAVSGKPVQNRLRRTDSRFTAPCAVI